jgi:hypothetical protein
MNEDHFVDPNPVAQPEQDAVEGRLDLRSHHPVGTRYRLLNLRDCAAPNRSEDEEGSAG